MLFIASFIRGGIPIFVRRTDGKSIRIEIVENEKILEMKIKIRGKLGIDPDEQELTFQGTPLEDYKTSGEYGICYESVIDLVARPR